MVTTTEYSARDIALLLGDDETIDQVNVWLARGDGIAVYQNVALDSATLGDNQFVSFGSPAAQLEVDEPPTQLPDMGNAINWRFQLQGTYRGEPLDHLPEMEWITPFVFCERTVRNFTDSTMNFAERVSSWGMEVRTVLTGSGLPTEGRRVDVSVKLLDPFVEIHVQTWMYREGINALGPFEWFIADEAHGTRTGTDPNLGATNVNVYNTCLRDT